MAINITNVEAQMSINLSTKLLLISTKRCSAILQWFLLMLILHSECNHSTLIRLTNFSPSSYFFHVSLTKLSKNSNSLRITKIVSMGDKKIITSMKCVSFFYLTKGFVPTSTCSISLSSTIYTLGDSIGKRLLKILAPVKMLCLVPQSQFNCSKVASSSSTTTYK
jgi:hypothetical protein